MRRFSTIAALAGVALASPMVACAQVADPPTLVVMISVDQLRGDLIGRYEQVLDGGLRRLLDDGFRYTGASHAHAVTHTAAGHAALSTGVFPARSGIVANSWSQRSGDSWAPMYAVEDRDSPILGFETIAQLPGRSPKNLLRGGLADWVRAQDPDARTLSVSSKDRAAITMAGRTDSNVYWLLSQLARFITSTYYGEEYPDWVSNFNDRRMMRLWADTMWTSMASAEEQRLARADSASYEGDGVHTTFPHLSSQEAGMEGPQGHYAWMGSTSYADRAVLEFTKTGIDELDLGQRGPTDYLAVSFSATDYVGHGYGPLSQEQLSNLIHLDGILGEFFEYLDDEVGEGRWVAGLSGDHGVVNMPEAEHAMGNMDVRRRNVSETTGLIEGVYQDAANEGGSLDEIAARAGRMLEERGIVEKAYTHHDLTVGEPADSFAVLFRNSHHPDRAHHPLSTYGLEYRFPEGDLVSYPTGTTHGSPYWYDRWVPFMLIGAGIEPGESDEPVYTVDLAPTLAALAGIRVPDDLDGRAVIRR